MKAKASNHKFIIPVGQESHSVGAVLYAAIRPSIKTGDVIAFQGNWWQSKMIRWWTGAEVSHVAIAVWLRFSKEEEDRLFVIESTGGGVRLALMSMLLPYYHAVGGRAWWLPLLPGFNGETIAQEGLKILTSPYPSTWRQYFRVMLRRLYGKRGDTDAKAYHCAEAVAHCLARAGYQHDYLPSVTTPGEVMGFSCFGPKVELVE